MDLASVDARRVDLAEQSCRYRYEDASRTLLKRAHVSNARKSPLFVLLFFCFLLCVCFFCGLVVWLLYVVCVVLLFGVVLLVGVVLFWGGEG